MVKRHPKTISKLTWLFPILLVVYEISVYLSNDMYLPALPNMMHDLQISATQAQLTITMWFIGAASTPLVMGALADHFGRRPTLLIGGIIYVFATIICALAINESTILIPRLLQGAMISSMMVSGYACIHESYEHKEAIRLLAIMGGVSVLAPALGPLLGAIVLSFASWRFIFWIIGLLSTIMLISLYYNMPETLFPERRQALNLGTIMNNYWLVITNKKFIMTGSSARKLKKGGANLLAGRAFVFDLFPLSFLELKDKFDLEHALRWGTLPQIFQCNTDLERQQFLRAYAHTYLKEEIWEEHFIRQLDPFRRFLEVAAQCNGKIINFSNIARDVGVDKKTIQSYFSILEDTLIGFYLEPYQNSFRKRLSQKPKFYLLMIIVLLLISYH